MKFIAIALYALGFNTIDTHKDLWRHRGKACIAISFEYSVNGTAAETSASDIQIGNSIYDIDNKKIRMIQTRKIKIILPFDFCPAGLTLWPNRKVMAEAKIGGLIEIGTWNHQK